MINQQVPKEQMRWLEDRIRELEYQNMHAQSSQPQSSLVRNGAFESSTPQLASIHPVPPSRSFEPEIQRSVTVNPPNDHSTTARSIKKPYYHSSHSTTAIVPSVNPQAPDPSEEPATETSSDGHFVHAVIGAPLDEHHREGFFGSSSAGTFMQKVKQIVEQRLSGSQQSIPPALGRNHDESPRMVPGHDSRQTHMDYVLPSRKRADNLMASYWTYVHNLYPFLDKAETQEDYDRTWRGDGTVSDERSFLCLLNIIFAISCQIAGSTALEERGRSAAEFYLRAREMLDVVETGSVRSVQTYLLLGQYFQSTNEPHPCWVFVGLGIRTAQRLA